MKRNCYILESGWIIEGELKREDTGIISLKDAYVVRKWSNGRGIGGIAKKEYRNEYTLDEIGESYKKKDAKVDAHEGSFDTDSFFEAAVQRSLGNN